MPLKIPSSHSGAFLWPFSPPVVSGALKPILACPDRKTTVASNSPATPVQPLLLPSDIPKVQSFIEGRSD